MPEADAEIPYMEITDPDFGRRAASTFVLQGAGPVGSLLSGPCPRCGHPCDIPVVDNVFKGPSALPGLFRRSRRQPAGDRVEPMLCECGGQHTGRPAGRAGCGAYWTLVVKVGSR